ncbi:MAG: hypothetical protein GF341_05275 [candidate division Zixibacteria bacterium]|nr:hypothetical protein [candidate division Zixibacteria bacterium]
MMMKRWIVRLGIGVCVLVTFVGVAGADASYDVRIIDRDSWVELQTTEDWTLALIGEQGTLCLWVDPTLETFRSEGGFEFLICYDDVALNVVSIERGPDLDPDWEHFEADVLPGGRIRLVGVADTSGAPHPPESAFDIAGCIAELTFEEVTPGNLENDCRSLTFCTFACDENLISNRTRDTVFIPASGHVPGPGYDSAACVGASGGVVAGIDYSPGLMCFAEPPNDRGDLNLNGIQYEIGDAILFENMILYGRAAFDPDWSAKQFENSDANCDTLTMTLVDYTYIWNVISSARLPCDDNPTPPAADGPPVSLDDSLWADTQTVNLGDTFTVDLSLTNVDTLSAVAFRLTYNPALISPVDSLYPDSARHVYPELYRGQSDVTARAIEVAPGVLHCLVYGYLLGDSGIVYPGEGPFLGIEFEVVSESGGGVSPIAFALDPDFANMHNTMVDRHAAIWKRPVLIDGRVTVNGVCECPSQGDMDDNGVLDASDLNALIDVVFFNSADITDPDCPVSRADVTGDGHADEVDLNAMIEHLFFNGVGPMDPCL